MKQNLNVNKAVLETNKHELGLSLAIRVCRGIVDRPLDTETVRRQKRPYNLVSYELGQIRKTPRRGPTT